MDKAQEKIASMLEAGDIMLNPPGGLVEFIDKEAVRQSRVGQISQALYDLGYRKLPEGEPPLLSDEEIREIISEWEPFTVASAPQFGITKNVAQAQRDSDIKWYGGKDG